MKGSFVSAPGGRTFQRVKVLGPPGSGRGAANGKDVVVRWGLKETGNKPLAYKGYPDRL